MKKFKRVLAAIMLMTAVIMPACSPEDEPSNNGGNNNGGGNGTYNGHDYVDLGLPSGTLWATCNVGATTPDGYGDYFAWGETEPKSVYGNGTYKYCDADGNNYSKYTRSDGLTILLSSDDAATVNWGSDWRTPIKEQWEELMDNTTSAWTTQNDVLGRVFYGNGHSLFLPAAGGYFYGNELEVGWGVYWSSTRCSNEDKAWYFGYLSGHNADEYAVFSQGRSNGSPVRPVRSAR